jgi:O-antigen ligase
MEKTLNHNLLEKPAFWMLVLGLFAVATVLSAIIGVSFWLLIASILFILSLILLVKNPLLLLSLLIITRMSLDYSAEYFTFTFFEIPISLSQILGISVAILGITNIVIKHKTLPSFQLIAPFLIIFLWGSATLTYSIAPYDALYDLLRFFDIFTLGFLTYTTVKKINDLKKLLLAFLISGILPVIFALYQLAFGIGLQYDASSTSRIFGTFSHPNIFGLYLFALIVFTWLFFLIFSHSFYEIFFTLFMLCTFALILFLTFTRIAWVALFVFVFLLGLFRYRLLLLPLIVLPIVLFAFSQNFQERVMETFNPKPDSSVIWRKTLWKDVTTESTQNGNFWFGSGMNTFPIVSENLRGISFGSNDPHNDFVKFFVEGGAVGLVIYILYLASIFLILLKKYFQSLPQSNLQLAFFILIIFFFTLEIASLTDNVFKNTPVQWLFFSAFGGLLALAQKEKIKRSGAI